MAKQSDLSEKALQATGKAVVELGFAMQGYRALRVEIRGISIRKPPVSNGEFLLTIRGTDEDGKPVVAFHTAFELAEALRGVYSRTKNGSLKWRPDAYNR